MSRYKVVQGCEASAKQRIRTHPQATRVNLPLELKWLWSSSSVSLSSLMPFLIRCLLGTRTVAVHIMNTEWITLKIDKRKINSLWNSKIKTRKADGSRSYMNLHITPVAVYLRLAPVNLDVNSLRCRACTHYEHWMNIIENRQTKN